MLKKRVFCSVLALTALSACAGNDLRDVGGQFWQRVSVSESIYQQGPKAQQMLNRDIARCVVELRELEELGAIKDAIPTDYRGRTLDPDQQALLDQDTPERDKNLYAEQGDYNDFESCMKFKGWERVEHVPYDVSRKGRENYLRAHATKDYNPAEYEKVSRASKGNSNEDGDFGNLND